MSLGPLALQDPGWPPQLFLHRGWGYPGQETPPDHNLHPARSHPRPQDWVSSRSTGFSPAPSEDLDFSYHKRASVPLWVPTASPTGGKAELFLENSRVCSRTQDGACLSLHPGSPLPSPLPPCPLSSSLFARCCLFLPSSSLCLCLALTLTPSISLFSLPLLLSSFPLTSPFSPDLLSVSSPSPSSSSLPQILFLVVGESNTSVPPHTLLKHYLQHKFQTSAIWF